MAQAQRANQRNADYWQARFNLIEAAQRKNATTAVDAIGIEFRKARREIDSQISRWYIRFARNNEIDLAEARRLLNANELAEFKWDVNQYIKYGQENAIDGRWAKQLENASARVHISRLEALKIQTQNTAEKLYGKFAAQATDLMGNTYRDGYYRTAYEIQRGTGVGWELAAIDERRLEKVLAKPWTTDNRSFSQNIWGKRDRLVDEVHKQLVQGMILGTPPRESIDVIERKFETSRFNASRLIMTESAYFANVADLDAYKDMGVERYQIMATLDKVTCSLCAAMDGIDRPLTEFEPGVTAPPFHAFCRCTTVPYFDDGYGERAARGEDGETYYVPDGMTYDEWQDKVVDGGDNVVFTSVRASGKIGDTDGYTVIDAVRDIDYQDSVAVQREINKFLDKHSDSEVEHAIVIAKSGKLYEFTGTSGTVNTLLAGKDELKGSIGAHSHPIWVGHDRGDSFSRDDLLFTAEHGTSVEYLTSGSRREAFAYTGKLTPDEIYKEYQKAKVAVFGRAMSSQTAITWEQEEIFRELLKTLEGLTYYEL